jgi:hypothetical protein
MTWSNPSALLCLGFLACLPGCGSLTGEFTTNRDPHYDGKLERLLIVYYNEADAAQQLGSKFSDAFLGRLSAVLARRNVPVHVARPMQGALDEQGVVRLAAARFQPRQVMQFALSRIAVQSGVTRSSFESGAQFVNNQSVTFTFSLAELGSSKYVWRGNLRYSVIPEGTTVADQLVAQLVAERFLLAVE